MPQIDLRTSGGSGGAAAATPDFFSAQVRDARRFCFDLKPTVGEHRLRVVCGGLERCSADYRIERATFRYYSLEYVVGGRGTLTLNDVTQPLGPGDLFTYGPRVKHVIASDARQPLHKYFIDFSGARAAALLRDCGLAPGTVAQTAAPQAIAKLLGDLIDAAEGHGPRRQAICALILEQVLLTIAETTIPARSLGSRSFATFQACRAYIVAHHLRLTDLGPVTAACDVDVSYLCRLFQRFDRQGPYRFLMNLRMTAAAQLLGRPGVLVKAVAEQMGFSDQFHFSRAFRRVHGVSPRDFQRLHEART
jgi:AraC-like DNA-binding protein